MIRPIAISLSPNTEKDDVELAINLLFRPWLWIKGRAVFELEEKFRQMFKVERAMAVNSGRAAEYVVLKSLGIGPGDEILIQAFTCVVVPNPILWIGAKPVYVDINPKTYNMDPADLERKITPRSKAVIIQHTFGQPAEIEAILKICQKYGLYLIEDCAHSLGATYKGKLVGTFGDAAFFSFGRDKVISSVFGGMAVIKEKKINIDFPYSSLLWVFRQLLHPLLFNFLILPTYNFLGIGKVILFFLQKLKVLSLAVYPEEKVCQKPPVFPAKIANAQALLVLHQLEKLEKFNQRRKEIADFYFENLKNLPLVLPPKKEGTIYLRFAIQTKKNKEIFEFFKRRGILLGDWYNNVIAPKGVDLKAAGYKMGSCPKAEEAVEKILNLPTYPLMGESEKEKVVSLLKVFFGSK